MSVGIFFGSSMGNAEEVAGKIADKLGLECEVINIANADAAKVSSFDSLICGSSTWGTGDLQDDWESFDFGALDVADKKVALFAVGDSEGYSDSFCGALGKLYDAFADKGANIIGAVSTDGYTFEESEGVREGKFVGLAIDQDNQSDLTDERVEKWCDAIRSELK